MFEVETRKDTHSVENILTKVLWVLLLFKKQQINYCIISILKTVTAP